MSREADEVLTLPDGMAIRMIVITRSKSGRTLVGVTDVDENLFSLAPDLAPREFQRTLAELRQADSDR
jgi:hypothetical protein